MVFDGFRDNPWFPFSLLPDIASPTIRWGARWKALIAGDTRTRPIVLHIEQLLCHLPHPPSATEAAGSTFRKETSN